MLFTCISSTTDRGTSDKAETIEHGALTDMAKGSFVKDSAWTE